MTKQEIDDGNNLIAEFMQLEMNDFGHYIDKNHLFSSQLKLFPFELKFNKSWDWLMPVVEKIEKLGFETFLGISDITGGYYMNIITGTGLRKETIDNPSKITCLDKSKKDCVYRTVVEFIKWYNHKNKLDDKN